MNQYDIYNIFDRAFSYMRPSEERHVTEVVVHEGVIPIIFVPGVMGSNLKNTVEGGEWRVDSFWSVLGWLFKSAADRKILLNPAETEVDPEGKPPEGITNRYVDENGRTIPPEELARARGWGEVSRMSYGDFLVWLENQLNIDDNAAFEDLESRLSHHYRHFSGQSAEAASARAEADVRTLGRFNFPVHACGYNWLQSNTDSAATLGDRVNEIIEGYRRARMRCDRAILVTHSMGGLVARYYSEVDGGNEHLLGIVHGVMPTTGAAVFYRRMKCGADGGWATRQVLGASAREMTAVLAQAPGPLQLVPTPEYGRGWFRIEKDGRQIVSLPTGNDPYTEIYLERDHWWGMMEPVLAVPEVNGWSNNNNGRVEEAWTVYQNLILDRVQPFHNALTDRFNSATYLFYADSSEHMSYGTVSWQGRAMNGGSGTLMTDRILDRYDEHRVIREDEMLYYYTMSEPDEAGDGTVPARSGGTGTDSAQASLAISTSHESAYDQESARLFTLGAILALAAQVS